MNFNKTGDNFTVETKSPMKLAREIIFAVQTKPWTEKDITCRIESYIKNLGWKDRAEKLWELLDDIDTASDMFKPPKNNFYNYVMRKAETRHRYLTSDGYNLFLTKLDLSPDGKNTSCHQEKNEKL